MMGWNERIDWRGLTATAATKGLGIQYDRIAQALAEAKGLPVLVVRKNNQLAVYRRPADGKGWIGEDGRVVRNPQREADDWEVVSGPPAGIARMQAAVEAAIAELRHRHPGDTGRWEFWYDWCQNSRLELVSGYICPETGRMVISEITIRWPYLYEGLNSTIRLAEAPEGAKTWRTDWLAATDCEPGSSRLSQMLGRAVEEWLGRSCWS